MTKANKNFENIRTGILKSVGNYCKNIRVSLKLTQKELSNIFKIDQGQICKFEKGTVDSVSLYIMYESLLAGENIWQE